MSLSRQEQELLEGIAYGLHVDDPGFAVTLTFAGTDQRVRRRAALARGGLWAAAVMMLAGVALVGFALSTGVITAACGFGVMLAACLATPPDRPPPGTTSPEN